MIGVPTKNEVVLHGPDMKWLVRDAFVHVYIQCTLPPPSPPPPPELLTSGVDPLVVHMLEPRQKSLVKLLLTSSRIWTTALLKPHSNRTYCSCKKPRG